jgi:hypothetical protein
VAVSTEDTAVRSSLVDCKNNSTAGESASTEQTEIFDHFERPSSNEHRFGRYKYDCRYDFYNIEPEASDGETSSFMCKSWDCARCATWMRGNLLESVERIAKERPDLRRFLTVTVDPDRVPPGYTEAEWLGECWNRLMTRLRREYDGISYLCFSHFHQGQPHRQAIVNRYIPQEKLSEWAYEAGFGEVADIRAVNARNVAKYLTKYLADGALANAPDGFHRYSSSADLDLEVRGPSDSDDDRDWKLMMDDYEITPVSKEEGPLRREATSMDLFLQRQRGGPLGVPPPDPDDAPPR